MRSGQKSRDVVVAVAVRVLVLKLLVAEPIGTVLHLHVNEAFLLVLRVFVFEIKSEVRIDGSIADEKQK